MYKVRGGGGSDPAKPATWDPHNEFELFNVLVSYLPSSRYKPVSRYKQPLRICMRNGILRSANAKYHHCYLFFYKINKRRLTFYSLLCFFV